jgi:hypothetical protein
VEAFVLKDHRYAGLEIFGKGNTDGKEGGGRVNKSRIVLGSLYPARTGRQPTDNLFRAGLSGCTYIFYTVKILKT